MFAFKLFFLVMAVLTLVGGVVMLKNFSRIFSVGSAVPSENESTLLLNKAQVVVIWLMLFKLFAMMAIIL